MKDHDFNWVAARRACTFACRTQVDLFYEGVESSVEASRKNDSRPLVECQRENHTQWVVRKKDYPHLGHTELILFEIDGDNLIVERCLPKQSRDHHPLFTATMYLDESGDCRYRIKTAHRSQEGLFRWQVIREALEDLYFGN